MLLVIVRNEILLLQSELEEWKNRAKFAKEKFQSLMEESNDQVTINRWCAALSHNNIRLAKLLRYFMIRFPSFAFLQLLVLKNEKEAISNAKEKAFNVIHNLHEKIFNLQVLDLTT